MQKHYQLFWAEPEGASGIDRIEASSLKEAEQSGKKSHPIAITEAFPDDAFDQQPALAELQSWLLRRWQQEDAEGTEQAAEQEQG